MFVFFFVAIRAILFYICLGFLCFFNLCVSSLFYERLILVAGLEGSSMHASIRFCQILSFTIIYYHILAKTEGMIYF